MRLTLAEVESDFWNSETEESIQNYRHLVQVSGHRPFGPRVLSLHGLTSIRDGIIIPFGFMTLFDPDPVPKIIKPSASSHGTNNTRYGE
jgi:hypothetical protein